MPWFATERSAALGFVWWKERRDRGEDDPSSLRLSVSHTEAIKYILDSKIRMFVASVFFLMINKILTSSTSTYCTTSTTIVVAGRLRFERFRCFLFFLIVFLLPFAFAFAFCHGRKNASPATDGRDFSHRPFSVRFARSLSLW